MIDERLFYALRVNLKSVVHLVVISIAAALFLNFSNVFQTRQVSEISFFLLSAPVISFSIDFLTLPAHANVSD